MKALLISINPEHALNILKGDKTRELRKSVPKDFVGWVYGYVTKGKPYITMQSKTQFTLRNDNGYTNVINATIPFRFWFEEYEEVLVQHHIDSEQIERVLKQACIEHDDLDNYVGNKETIYAWHIKKLEIFDKPMGLGEFYTPNKDVENVGAFGWAFDYEPYIPLTKAPQSYQYVWVKGE